MILQTSAWARIATRRIIPYPRTRPHLRPHIPKCQKHASSTPPAPLQSSPPSSAPKTIPGPAWLWLEPIATPFRAYGRIQQRRPYMTQFVSALVIYLVGDICAQSINPATVTTSNECAESNDEVSQDGSTQAHQQDYTRTARALIIGGMAAVPGYNWFVWLANNFNYRSKLLSLTTKVVVNQIVFTPIFNSYFFGMQSLLTGATVPEIIERIKNTVPVSWVNSCKIWPAVTAFSFTFIPLQFRSIFGGVIAIGWQTYLSLLNQRAAIEEKEAHGHEGAVSPPSSECDRERRAQQAAA